MQLKITSTEFADLVPETTDPLSEGVHHLYIENGSYDPDKEVMAITFRSLDKENECSTIRYFLRKKDGTYNGFVIGTLNKFKYALSGVKKGVLMPCDFCKGIVIGEVKLGEPTANKYGEMVQYPNLNDFEPVSASYYELAKTVVETIPQFVTEE